MQLAETSTQYYSTAITPSPGVAYDPTADAVSFCFLTDPSLTPQTGQTWTAGRWQPGGGPRTFVAECLIGPANSGLVLAAGDWYPWMKVGDNPEVPIVRCPEVLTVLA